MGNRYVVRWSRTAADDLKEILSYIARNDGIEAARRLHRSVMKATRALHQNPARCRVVPELKEHGVTQYRELLVGPYRIVIRVSSDIVGLVAIFDGRRDLEDMLLARALRSE